MTTSPETTFRQRFCRARHCGRLFFICSRCYRGQCSCSIDCRHLARRDQLRAARRRHQQSPEGQVDHCDRQRASCRRLAAASRSQAQKIVTDHASKPDLISDTIARPHSGSLIAPLRSSSLALDVVPGKYIRDRTWSALLTKGWRRQFMARVLGTYVSREPNDFT